MLAGTTTVVHTTGINWESVATIVAAVVGALTALITIVGRYLSNRITGAIDKFRVDVIGRMDTRISLLEQQVFGQPRNGRRRRGDRPE